MGCGGSDEGSTAVAPDTEDKSQDLSAKDVDDVQGSDLGVQCTNDSFCDDGLYCNGEERCEAANESANELGCVAGTPPSMEDPNPFDCHVLDKCDEAGKSILWKTLGIGSECDDGVPCTDNDVCTNGQSCEGTPNDSACDDGLYCTGTEKCLPAVGCVSGTAPSGEDINPHDCLVPHCDNAIGAFVMVFAKAGSPCYDEWPCTIFDECTLDGHCKGQPQNELCDDDRWCNGGEVCHPKSGCLPGVPPSPPPDDDPNDCLAAGPCNDLTQSFAIIPSSECDDGVECTVDQCDLINGCVGTPNDSWCDDGLFCNGTESCDATKGCVSDTTLKIEDTIGCTIDACDEATQTITHTVDDTQCDDGFFCNGKELCNPSEGCTAGSSLTVEDGISCTVDLCDEITDTINHIPSNNLCDDGLYCNGEETCDSVKDCQGAKVLPEPPVDGNPLDCLIYAGCEEATNSFPLVFAPKGTLCDNSASCATQLECQPGGACLCGVKNCDDGNPCTLGTFEQSAEDCVYPYAPSGIQCDDGVLCTLNDQCDGKGSCSGTIKDCDDGNPCTTDTCLSSDASCKSVVVNDGVPCEDGDPSTGNESCTDGLCGGGIKDCNDNNMCTVDSFNSETGKCESTAAPPLLISYDAEYDEKQGQVDLSCGTNIIVNAIGAGCEISGVGKLRAYSGTFYGPEVTEGCSTVQGTLFEGNTTCCFI
jgi:hypothetical protein